MRSCVFLVLLWSPLTHSVRGTFIFGQDNFGCHNSWEIRSNRTPSLAREFGTLGCHQNWTRDDYERPPPPPLPKNMELGVSPVWSQGEYQRPLPSQKYGTLGFHQLWIQDDYWRTSKTPPPPPKKKNNTKVGNTRDHFQLQTGAAWLLHCRMTYWVVDRINSCYDHNKLRIPCKVNKTVWTDLSFGGEIECVVEAEIQCVAVI